jgi:ABC-2 type transport system permease protein
MLGLGALALVQMTVYPSIRKSAPQMLEYVETMPDAMKAMFGLDSMDYTSPAGYLNTELFSMIVPMVFAAFAMGAGSRAVAGEEDRKTLDLLLSTPVSRRSIVAQKFVAMAVDIAALAVVLSLCLWLGGMLVNFDLDAGHMLAACLNAGLLGLVMGSIALLIGSWRGGRGFSIGVTGALLVGFFLLQSLSQIVDGLRPFRKMSPFYWYSNGDVLRNGLALADTAVLLVLPLILAWLALIAFDRRDIHA